VNLRLVAVREILYSTADDFLGGIHGVGLVELDMLGKGEFGLGACGYELGVDFLRQLAEGRHDALDVDYHCVNGARGKGQFLLEEIPGDGNTVAHEDFDRRAADAAEVDARGALALGEFHQFLVVAGGNDHLRKGGLVAMDDNVDGFRVYDAEVCDTLHPFGGAEEHIGDFRGDHAPAPAVAERCADALEHDVQVVVVHADVGAVHYLDDLAVDSARDHAGLAPVVPGSFGRAGGEDHFAVLLSELAEGDSRDAVRDLAERLAFGFDAQFFGERPEFLLVLDLIVALIIFGGHEECVGYIAAVVGVGGRARGDHACEVAGCDYVGRRAADALARPVAEGVDAARPHCAVTTAESELSEPALGLHDLVAVPGHEKVRVARAIEHFDRGGVNASAPVGFHGSPHKTRRPTSPAIVPPKQMGQWKLRHIGLADRVFIRSRQYVL